MKRGEVWRVRLPATGGHTQAGERPAVIVQNDKFSQLPTVLLVPFTSRMAASRFPGTLVVQPDGGNGLTSPSVALVFQVSVQDKRSLVSRLGTIDDATLAQISRLLSQLMN